MKQKTKDIEILNLKDIDELKKWSISQDTRCFTESLRHYETNIVDKIQCLEDFSYSC